MSKIFALFVLFVVAAEGRKFFGTKLEEYCWATDPIKAQKFKFASRTPYQIVKGDPSLYSEIPGCTPQKFWFISRHGTRLPSAKNIDKFAELPEIRDTVISNYASGGQPSTGALCPEDLALISNWQWNTNITVDLDEFLVDQGWDDLKGVARAYRTAFPTLLPETYSSEDYFFRHTNTQRTQASYKAFVDGLFGENAYQTVPAPVVPEQDFLLRPQDNCPPWQEHDAVFDLEGTEPDNAEQSVTYKAMVLEVSQRLGYTKALKGGQIRSFFNLCRYEQAWFLDQVSPWCAAFTPEHIALLEYAEDVKYYFKTGWGTSLNYNLGCEMVASMLETLDNPESPSTALFTHQTTMHLLLVAMGMHKDEIPLLTNNFEILRDSRKWRSSHMGQFATNMAVVKYDCPNGEVPEKALFLYNEKPMDIEWCDNGVCDWSVVKERFAAYSSATCRDTFCNFD